MRRFVIASILISIAISACGEQGGSDKSKVVQTKPVETAKPVIADVKTTAEKSVQLPSLENGAKFYKRCAACHQANGQGLKGTYPPLGQNYLTLAASESGRDYLVLTLVNGLQGPLEIEGVTYRGVMTAQARSKSDQTVADVLNYISDEFHPDKNLTEFTADEIAKVKEKHGRLTAKKVRELRPE